MPLDVSAGDMNGDSVVIEIVEQISDQQGVDPIDLDPLLYDVIEVDALEALTTETPYRQPEPDLRVEFTYHGHTVTVDRTGRVVIGDTDMEANTDEAPTEVAGTSRTDLSAEIDRRERALNDVTAIITDLDRSFTEQVDALLEVVREVIGVDYATLSYVDHDTYVFEAVAVQTDADLQAGTTVPLEELPACRRVVETEQELVLRDVEAEAPELADPTWGIASYIGVPVFVNDAVYGTFCFYDMDAQAEEFSDWDLTFVELLSKWVSSELEQREQRRTIGAYTLEQPAPPS